LGLENLRSIFQDDIQNRADDYQVNQPLPGGTPPSILLSAKGTHSEAAESVILDTLLRQPPAFVSEDLLTKFYDEQQFDSRIPKNNRITISNINTYTGTQYKATSPTDLATLGLDLATQDWSNLYNASHTPKNNPEWGGNVPISYPGVNRDKLRIRNDDAKSGIFNFGRTELLGAGSGEPYIVSHLPTDNFLSGGRVVNAGSRSVPIVRAVTDTLRLTKYLSSAAGVAFIAKQNALGYIGSKVEWPMSSKPNISMFSPQRFGRFYNPLSTLGSSLARIVGTTPNVLIRRDVLIPSPTSLSYGGPTTIPFKLDETFTNYDGLFMPPIISDLETSFPIAGGTKFKNPSKKSGDKMTLAKMIEGNSLDTILGLTTGLNDGQNTLAFSVEDKKEGMPLYFKDLRDNKYIFFRAYIEGLTENIAPTWASTNYIGRSEPVYVYERSERDITFTLRLVAQTSDELGMIYKKMNKLTSLCYPQYMADVNLGGKIKMKPPLTKFRMGEIFGKSKNELMGFIKSLNYSVEQSSTWETESGKRVPRHVTANITYQVIHASVPQLDTQFYGYVGD